MKSIILGFFIVLLSPIAAWAQTPMSGKWSESEVKSMWKYDDVTKTLTICPDNGEEIDQLALDINVLASDGSVNKLGSDDNWTYTKGVQKSFGGRSGIYVSSIPTYDEEGEQTGVDQKRQNYRFVDFVPTSGNITVGFNVPNTLSGLYDIYIVTCPMWLASDYNNIDMAEWDVRPYRFTATIIERENEGKNIGQFPTKGKTLENPNPIDEKQKTVFLSQGMNYDDAGHIIVNDTTYLGQYQFKESYYGSSDYGVIIQIASSILSSQRKDFSNEMLISSIILKPHDDNTFKYVNNPEEVEHVVVDNEITTMDYPFSVNGFQNIKSVNISNSITSIGKFTFQNCRHLTNIVLGNNVKNIAEGAFDNCLVACIYNYADFPPEATQGKNDTKDSFSIVKANCKLYVKPESIDLYKVDPYWSQFNVLPMNEDALDIESVDNPQQRIEVLRYSQDGIEMDVPQRGVNIIRYSDGTIKKVYVK